MSAPQTDTVSQDLAAFYVEDVPELTDEAKAVFTQYSGIAEAELDDHIASVRDKAWAIFKYPCVGQYSFVKFNISSSKDYPSVLSRVKAGDKLLDLGCCFAQDLRKLVFDGAPAENLYASELEQGFLDLGHDLFRDKDRLTSRMTSGDFFKPATLAEEEGFFDIVYAASFYHLFSWDEQVEAWSKTLGLLKPKPGSMIFGRQTAVKQAGAIKHPATRSGEMYRHDIDSFKKLLDEVAEKTGIKLDVQVGEYGVKGHGEVGAKGWNMMGFAVTLL